METLMPTSGKSPHPKSKYSKTDPSIGNVTLDGTVKNLVSGMTYDLKHAEGFYRLQHKVMIYAPNPESEGSIEIEMYFGNYEPPSQHYPIGPDKLPCSYNIYPQESFYAAESGTLDLENIQNTRTLKGNLKFTTRQFDGVAQYSLSVRFTITGG